MHRTKDQMKQLEQQVLLLHETIPFQTEIALKLGIAQSFVSTILRRHGIHHGRGFHLHSQQKQDTICKLTLFGYSTTEIGHIMGISAKVVQKAIRRYKDKGLLPQEAGLKKGSPSGTRNHFYVDGKNGQKRFEREKNRPEYRAVAAKMLGRDLLPEEEVHHIDFDPGNNSPENLCVMTRDEHIRLHMARLGQIRQSQDHLPDLGHKALPKYQPLRTGEKPSPQ